MSDAEGRPPLIPVQVPIPADTDRATLDPEHLLIDAGAIIVPVPRPDPQTDETVAVEFAPVAQTETGIPLGPATGETARVPIVLNPVGHPGAIRGTDPRARHLVVLVHDHGTQGPLPDPQYNQGKTLLEVAETNVTLPDKDVRTDEANHETTQAIAVTAEIPPPEEIAMEIIVGIRDPQIEGSPEIAMDPEIAGNAPGLGNVDKTDETAGKNLRQNSNRNHYNGQQNGYFNGGQRNGFQRNGEMLRDRANSWGQSQYFPSESQSQFIAPTMEKRFTDLQFPANWALPSERDFRRYFDRIDILPLLGKPQAFGLFDGQVANYPGWQENFYRVVHVQAVPLIHKVNALDQAVNQEVKNKYFKDLTSSAEDYLIRIRRLEEKFGGPGKHLSNMMQRIKAVSEIGKDLTKVQDAIFALERFIESRYCHNPDDPLMSEIIRPNMKSEVRRQYRAFLEDRRLEDTPASILSFLRRTLTVETDKDKEKEKRRENAKTRIDRKKQKGKEMKNSKEKKANYQFFNAPSTDSETSSDSFLKRIL